MHTIQQLPKNILKYNSMLNENPTIHPSAQIRDCVIGSWTEIGAGSIYLESVFGDYSYDSGDAIVTYTEVGKFCSIASHARINPVNHPMERVTQHHCTYRRIQYEFDSTDDEEIFNWRRTKKCVLGHDVWIGHGAIIMPGVKIGSGAAIGSGAIVTKDIDPYEIAVGVPARPIKKRFSDDIIEKLLHVEWWNWDRNILKNRFKDFYNINTFLEKYFEG